MGDAAERLHNDEQEGSGAEVIQLFPGGAEAASTEEISAWLGRLREKIASEGPLLLTRETQGTLADRAVDFVVTGIAEPRANGGDPHYGVIEGTSYGQGHGQIHPPENGDYRNTQEGWIGSSTLFMWEQPLKSGDTRVFLDPEDDTKFRVTTRVQYGEGNDCSFSFFSRSFMPKNT